MLFLRVGTLTCLTTPRPGLLIIWLVILRIIAGVLIRTIISSWFIYVVILLFTGGIMVLFTYIRTITYSRKITFHSLSWYIWLLFVCLIILIPLKISSPLNYLELSSVYYFRGGVVLLGLARYLFLVLVLVVKLTAPNQGPLKANFKNEK